MPTHTTPFVHRADHAWQLRSAMSLPSAMGELRVLEGRVWLTRRGDAQDHWLEAGQSVRLHARDAAVIEPHGLNGATLQWRPMRQRRVLHVMLLRGVARTFRALELAACGVAALARSAAASARRAQGCIEAGEPIASSGTLQ